LIFAGGWPTFAPKGEAVKETFGMVLLFSLAFGGLGTASQQNMANDSAPCLSADIARSNLQSGTSGSALLAVERGMGKAHSENERGIAAILDSPRDLEAARRWFEKAARRSYAPAQVNLATMYLQGWGVPPNNGTGLYWLTLAAQQGHPMGLFDLGQMYLKGCGVHQDYPEALWLFREAERKGNAAAAVNIGYMYDAGLGVPHDQAAAVEWYRKAAEAGESAGEFNLGDLYQRGEGVAPDDRAAFEWFQKAAAQGHRKAQLMVGLMCAVGRGTPRDLEAAYAWIAAAQMEGESDTQDSLAQIEHQLSGDALQRAKGRARLLAEQSKH
jgi:TPR repeat protein